MHFHHVHHGIIRQASKKQLPLAPINVTQIKTRWKPGQHHSKLIISCVEVGTCCHYHGGGQMLKF